MTDCPSCGRYVGPYDLCPYCGARQAGRVRIRALRIAAVVCATIGLALLWFVATRSQVPLVQVGGIDAAMNMAYVRLAGTCVDAPSYDASSGYLSFWIHDGTGDIRVSSYREETQRLISSGRVPAVGDWVEVAGTIRVRDSVASLTVNVPEKLALTRAEPADRAIQDIGTDDQYQRVRVRGQVRDVREPYAGLTLVTVHDGTGAIPVVVSRDLEALSGALPLFSLGQSVEVVGAVSVYRGAPQLVPASTDDIVSLDESVPIADERPIGRLSAADVGTLVVVRGTVVELDDLSSGVRLALDDGSGRVAVVLWQSVHENAGNPAAIDLGALVRVLGEVNVYRGELEVVPALAADVQVLAGAPAAEETALPTDRAVRTPTRTQTLTATAQPAPSVRPSETPELGTIAPPATAIVSPSLPPAQALDETPTPPLPVTSIGAISTDRVGQQVTVEGEVVAAASFSAGFKFTISDGTGQVVLLMWHEIYDSCWDASQINLGARVRATGEVALYKGELQIQPGFGGDVEAITGSDPWAPMRDIGSLGGGDEGQRVMIEGDVLRVEGLSSAVKVFLGDDTGEVVVFIWRNILDRVAANTALGTPGSRVRVVGTVDLYRSNLEVIPALPVDVVVLTTP